MNTDLDDDKDDLDMEDALNEEVKSDLEDDGMPDEGYQEYHYEEDEDGNPISFGGKDHENPEEN